MSRGGIVAALTITTQINCNVEVVKVTCVLEGYACDPASTQACNAHS